MTASYDAVLIVSFGGPECMADVMPFLEYVTRGRNIPKERLQDVAAHYDLFGGVSPINAQVRIMMDALKRELAEHGPQLTVYWGNRNWHPFLADTLAKMRDDGCRKALAFATSAYSSYSSCRQYIEDIKQAQEQVGNGAPQVDKIRPFYNHPLFFDANLENIQKILRTLSPESAEKLSLVFTAHSIPLSMAKGCLYEEQLREICSAIAGRLQLRDWNLVYQSRSGPPQVPWLEPDILAHIRKLHDRGVTELLVHPVGFVSDHMEVVYDLDHEAGDLCNQLGMVMHRSETAGTHPAFVKMTRQLIVERMDNAAERAVIAGSRALPDQCSPDCCPSGAARPLMSSESPGQKRG